MIRLNRTDGIIQVLLNEEDYITYEKLAEIFQVSSATVRNDISEIERMIDPYGMRLEKRRGTGIRIIGDMKARSSLLNSVIQGMSENSVNDSRLNELLYYLIERKEEYLTIDKLAELLFVSRSTIHNDLKILKDRLHQEDLKLEVRKNKGVRLTGAEKDLRSIYSRVFNSQSTGSTSGAKSLPVQTRLLQFLHLDSEPIVRELHYLEKTCGFTFAQDSFEMLVVHIAIAVRRIQIKESVIWEEEMHREDHLSESAAVEQLCDVLEKEYDIAFHEAERYLIYLQVISARVANCSDYEKGDIEKDRVYRIAEEIIHLVENMKQVEIDESSIIFHLMSHLRPMVNRVVNGIHLENPLIEQIKREYSDAYGIAWMANSIFERYIGKKIAESEIGFLAIHIQIMTENQKEVLKVVIVCSNGIGISQLLSSRLKSHFAKLQIMGTMSSEEYYHFQAELHADLILSTVPLQTSKPLLMVSPLLPDADLRAINAYLEGKADQEHTLKDDVSIFTYIHDLAKTQKEVIARVHEMLYASGHVHASFQDAIWERELITSTAIGNHTALPHASFESVKRSAIVIVTLDHKLLWGDDEVDLIVFIALKKNDSIRLKKKLRALFYNLYSEELHTKIINANSEQSVHRLLKL